MSSSAERHMTIERAMGYVYGRFQALTTFVFAIGFCMGGFMSFALPLVELFPEFQCLNEESGLYEPCSREQACEQGQQWRIDWDDQRSIHNWVTDGGMCCIEKWKIGLFGSMYYFGYLMGSVCFVNVSDIVGRKLCARVSFIGHVVTFAAIIFCHGLYVRYVAIFLCGFIGSMRCSVSYNSGCEWLPKDKQIYSSMITQMLNACVPLCLAIYFWKISKIWYYFYYFTLTICIIDTCLCFLIPESPRWLVSEDKGDEARDVLNKVCRINSKEEISYAIDIIKDKVIVKEEDHNESIDVEAGSPLTVLMNNRIHRYNLLLATSFWFLACIMNYIMNFYIKYVKTDNIFLLIMFSAFAELISKTLNGFLLKMFSFKIGTLICISCSLLSSIIFLMFHDSMYLTMIVFFSKLFASATFASMYFACPTLFQSQIAVTAYNICNISGKVGAVIAPMIAELNGTTPMLVYAICAAFSLFIVTMFKIPILVDEAEVELKESNVDEEISDEK